MANWIGRSSESAQVDRRQHWRQKAEERFHMTRFKQTTGNWTLKTIRMGNKYGKDSDGLEVENFHATVGAVGEKDVSRTIGSECNDQTHSVPANPNARIMEKIGNAVHRKARVGQIPGCSACRSALKSMELLNFPTQGKNENTNSVVHTGSANRKVARYSPRDRRITPGCGGRCVYTPGYLGRFAALEITEKVVQA
ncbi:hypothetical protein FISHEDRAFT_62937 [Fistulina hepatica ATCC 64428]|uniref:Uncharacterized protein n=1 Tax=Fistulina hepatica ATCC 64428 TaxID=1128425 RepID=A0A0D7A0Z8_9AGAR|nr:hypothetical protein FISHEDRAFT_62937 [Fistulina hepatica ATCC 64428]